jgi:cation transport ATPase
LQVGVAIASTPKDMVAAAADIIVLNGQGITNLPWLFRLADRTHVILQQVGTGLGDYDTCHVAGGGEGV